MEKSEMMRYEEATGETLEEAGERGITLNFYLKYIQWLETKATAYNRLMSGGKKTLKEWANIFGMPIAVDQDGEASCFGHIPVMYLYDGEGIWGNNPKHYGEETYLLPPHLIDFNGDWKDSLTLPDGWREK